MFRVWGVCRLRIAFAFRLTRLCGCEWYDLALPGLLGFWIGVVWFVFCCFGVWCVRCFRVVGVGLVVPSG